MILLTLRRIQMHEVNLFYAPPNPQPSDGKTPCISLHALIGIQPNEEVSYMRIWVFIGSRHLTALLDSGSSKNFINT